jgi:hypothetical protein
MSGIGFSPAEENFGKYCGILDREVSAGGAKGYYFFGGRHRMTFSRAQHGAHRERVCPWDLSRDEFCGSVYFFAPIGKFETQRHRATEFFGNQTQGCRVLLVGHSVTGGEFRLICIFPTRSPCPLWLCVSNVRAFCFETQRHRAFWKSGRRFSALVIYYHSVMGDAFSSPVSSTPALRVLCASVFPTSAHWFFTGGKEFREISQNS